MLDIQAKGLPVLSGKLKLRSVFCLKVLIYGELLRSFWQVLHPHRGHLELCQRDSVFVTSLAVALLSNLLSVAGVQLYSSINPLVLWWRILERPSVV